MKTRGMAHRQSQPAVEINTEDKGSQEFFAGDSPSLFCESHDRRQDGDAGMHHGPVMGVVKIPA